MPKIDIQKTVYSINKALLEVGTVAGENANKIAPLDSGDLRRSLTSKLGNLTVTNRWSVDYAIYVYYKNNKTPSSTKWADKDIEKNMKKYKKYIVDSVEVYFD